MRNRLSLLIFVLVVGCGDNIKLGHDAGPDAATGLCGNGIVDPHEDCDDGPNNGGPDPCDTTCHWMCLDDTWCADTDPCNGAETCGNHACKQGTPLVDGTSCGTGKICRNAACTAAVCGDMFVTTPEECDDANSINGDGCETSCRFSCVSTDIARNCTPADACAGQGTCNDTTHVCAPGTPLPINTPCGTGGYCKAGVCTQPMCGNGLVEPGEVCDHGALNGTVGDGCKANCTFACVVPPTDCPAPPACEKEQCTASHVCQAVADATKNGMTCGVGLVCNNGSCAAAGAVCGNGVTETGEQCDFGLGNGPGTGCEANCTFSCTILPNSCNDNNPCNGTEACNMVTVMGHAGQKCFAGTPQANGTACGAGKICLSQLCQTSTCGDGFVNPMAGETCEPPNTVTCDAACHSIVCGDGVRNGTEQCDDSNTTNLDGCNATCKFEQDQRVNMLSLPFVPDAYCTQNALGGAIVGGTAQNQIAGALNTGVTNGSITIMFAALGLDDLTGTNDPALMLGALNGAPVAGAGYNGNADIDWWYTTAAASIDATRTPKTLVAATIAAKVLNVAGPASITIAVSLGGMLATLDMFGAKLRGNIGATSTPLASAGATPGHLAAEHLDPALVSYASMTAGELCGNVTAQSLKNVPAPTALVGCGLFNCSQCYTAANTLLDIVIGGCNVAFVGQQIKPTQPDAARTAGDVYVLTANAARVVVSCTKNGVADTLANCLMNGAYSSAFKFTTDRVIAK